jgi:hypothetical protein
MKIHENSIKKGVESELQLGEQQGSSINRLWMGGGLTLPAMQLL